MDPQGLSWTASTTGVVMDSQGLSWAASTTGVVMDGVYHRGYYGLHLPQGCFRTSHLGTFWAFFRALLVPFYSEVSASGSQRIGKGSWWSWLTIGGLDFGGVVTAADSILIAFSSVVFIG